MKSHKEKMFDKIKRDRYKNKKNEEIIKENSKPRNDKQESEDTKNRKYILQVLVNDIANGATEEEAIQNIMKNPIVEKLKYLENLPEIFKDWIKRDNTKKMILNRRREIQENKHTTSIDEDER